VPLTLDLRFTRPAARSRVRIARGSLRTLGAFVRAATGARRALIVTDTRVNALYGAAARTALTRTGIAHATLVLPRGERTKSAAGLARVWAACAAHGIGRRDAIVALGGGVIGDLAGFAAATWLRGVVWIGVPSTLLAQVDSSVGGKTGIDLAAGKNLAGAFHQPAGVLIDPGLLASLPPRQRRAGLAEVAKTAVIADRALFVWLERHASALAAGDPAALAAAVARTVRNKARVVTRDEREREAGGRAALNFGHTLGHALEAALHYRRLLHGEAVAIGMRVAARLSREAGRLSPDEHDRIVALLDALRLPRRMPAVPARTLLRCMAHDKKRSASGVRWVLTPQIGSASVPRLLPERMVRAALRAAGSGR